MSSLGYTVRKFLALLLVSLLTFIVVSRNLYPNISYFRDTSIVIIDRTKNSIFESEENVEDAFFIQPGRELFGNVSNTTAAIGVVEGAKPADVARILKTTVTPEEHKLIIEVAAHSDEVSGKDDLKNDRAYDDDIMIIDVETPGEKKKLTSRLFPNEHPDELLKCVHERMNPLYSRLIKYREWVLEHPHTWRPYNDPKGTNVTVYGNNKTYFEELRKPNNIQTFFFNETIENISPCLINGGYLQYDYGTNNCSSVIIKAKRYSMYGKSIYDLHCFKNQEMSLRPAPLNDAAFKVGLPENFEHPSNMKTLTYIHMIRDATVTVYGDVTTATHTIVPQRCFQDKRIPLPADPFEQPIYEEVFSMSQYYGKGMFHANIEDISRMAPYIKYLKVYPQIKIHVYDLEFPPVYLSRIDLDPRRFINGTIRANLLYVPQGINCCLPSLFGTQVESYYLRRNLPNPAKKDRNVIIVVKRRNRRGRYFRFHDKILKALTEKATPYGLKVWEFNDNPLPTLNETAHQFNRAFMVIAPHGAGESNLMFTQPGTILLEGLCIDQHDGLVNVVFRTISHLLGGFYYGFFKQDAHCTETTPEDLSPLLDFYLTRLDEFR